MATDLAPKSAVSTLGSTRERWWVFLAISLGSVMAGLDSSVSNTVLPVVAISLRADVATTQWVVLSYLLVTTVLVLSAGRLGDLQGHRRLYLLGFAVFVASSAACGFAPAIGWLIAARGCQALGAAMLFSNSPAILTGTFPDNERGRVLGLQATAVYLGLVVGPSLGGFLTASFGWGAVYLANVPVGVAGLVISRRVLPRDVLQSSAAKRFDLPGAVTFSLGLVLFILGLNQANVWGWTSPLFFGCFAVTGTSLAAFVWIEQHASAPMLDLDLFRNRQFSTAVTGATLNYAAGFAVSFVLPFYLIQGRGMSAAETGLVMTAIPVLMPVLSPLSGALSDRIGARLPATAGAAIIATALFSLSRLDMDTPVQVVVGSLVCLGLGMGLFTSPTASTIMGSAPRERRGVASGVMSTARGLGMVVGFGLGGTVFTAVLGRMGVGATPASVTVAADAAMLMAALLATLATIVLIMRHSSTGKVARAGGTVERLASVA